MNDMHGPPLAQFPFKHGRCLFSNARHKALFGGRCGAKSWSTATYLVVRATEREKLIVCARQYQNSIRDSSKSLIENRIRDLRLENEFWIADRAIRHTLTGSEFLFVGLERNVESIRSLEGADIWWTEEASTVSQEAMDVLLPTVRKPGSELIWTWNPRKPTDPVDKYFRGPRPRADAAIAQVNYWDHDFFKGTAAVAEMEALRNSNFKRYEHIWCGKYDVLSASKVFENVAIGRPKPEALMNSAPLYGLDFGYNDPTAAVRCHFLPELKTIYIAAEAYASGVTFDMLPEFLDLVVARRGDLVWADSASPGAIQLLESRGHGVRGVKKGKGSVQDGVQRMMNYKLLIDPDCENVRREVHSYSWPTDRLTGTVITGLNPVGGADHTIDAIRYATTNVLSDDTPDDDGGVLRLRLWGEPPRGDDPWSRRKRFD
jgi:phage terminase large subunit